jgi:hypothetical protein
MMQTWHEGVGRDKAVKATNRADPEAPMSTFGKTLLLEIVKRPGVPGRGRGAGRTRGRCRGPTRVVSAALAGGAAMSPTTDATSVPATHDTEPNTANTTECHD